MKKTKPKKPPESPGGQTRATETASDSGRAPAVRITPYAWSKLIFFRDRQACEVGGFGIAGQDDLLLITDFLTVKQRVTAASVEFDDQGVADHFDRCVDAGLRPEQFARTWVHTHPGDSPHPSQIDEECFRRTFARSDWAIMLILAKTGKCYCRLRFNTGPGGQIVVPVHVDYSVEFIGSEWALWKQEYEQDVMCQTRPAAFGASDSAGNLGGACFADPWMEELEAMDPAERRLVLDELGSRPDLWDEGDSDEWI